MRDVDALNAGYAGQLLEQYLENPSSVPPEWRALFERGEDAEISAALPGLGDFSNGRGMAATATWPKRRHPTQTDGALLNAVAAATSLVRATRTHGHRAARLDPLGSEPHGDPSLDPERLGLDARAAAAHSRVDAADVRRGRHIGGCRSRGCARPTAARSPTRSSTSTTTTSACGCARRSRPAATAGRSPATSSGACSARLAEVEGFEAFLRRTFLGQKQFSLEGLDLLVPMLDESIELAAADGVGQIVIGMAHRGRLNVLDPRGRTPVRPDPARVRGRADDRGRHRLPRGRDRRRQVPPRHAHVPPDAERRDRRDADGEPEPPRVRRPGRRGPHARGADRPHAADRAARPVEGALHPHPRRRRLPRRGHRRRNAEPL